TFMDDMVTFDQADHAYGRRVIIRYPAKIDGEYQLPLSAEPWNEDVELVWSDGGCDAAAGYRLEGSLLILEECTEGSHEGDLTVNFKKVTGVHSTFSV